MGLEVKRPSSKTSVRGSAVRVAVAYGSARKGGMMSDLHVSIQDRISKGETVEDTVSFIMRKLKLDKAGAEKAYWQVIDDMANNPE